MLSDDFMNRNDFYYESKGVSEIIEILLFREMLI